MSALYPAPFAGLTLERPRIMGVVNVTPDSFSDGGETETAEAAVARGRAMIEEGREMQREAEARYERKTAENLRPQSEGGR